MWCTVPSSRPFFSVRVEIPLFNFPFSFSYPVVGYQAHTETRAAEPEDGVADEAGTQEASADVATEGTPRTWATRWSQTRPTDSTVVFEQRQRRTHCGVKRLWRRHASDDAAGDNDQSSVVSTTPDVAFGPMEFGSWDEFHAHINLYMAKTFQVRLCTMMCD